MGGIVGYVQDNGVSDRCSGDQTHHHLQQSFRNLFVRTHEYTSVSRDSKKSLAMRTLELSLHNAEYVFRFDIMLLRLRDTSQA